MFEVLFIITLSTGEVIIEGTHSLHKNERKCEQEGWSLASDVYRQVISKHPEMEKFDIECVPNKVWI